MALNVLDRVAVRQNIISRCAAIVSNYALYLIGNVEATANQKAWAVVAARTPQSWGEQVSWYVINQPDFISDGSGITDATLTGAVETAINTHFIAAEE